MMFAGALMRERLRSLAASLKQEVQVYRLVLADRRTPWGARWLLRLAIGYLLSPIDLFPGHLDDAVIVPGLVYLALRRIPREVVAEAREKLNGR
jgi:uncharacterized membrane protein YkvA (DUF1232 family)